VINGINIYYLCIVIFKNYALILFTKTILVRIILYLTKLINGAPRNSIVHL